jgi:hypothetical protein
VTYLFGENVANETREVVLARALIKRLAIQHHSRRSSVLARKHPPERHPVLPRCRVRRRDVLDAELEAAPLRTPPDRQPFRCVGDQVVETL